MLIGLSGKPRSGKDTVAEYLVREMGCVQLSFIRPLKDILINLFQITENQIQDENLKDTIDPRYGKSPRQLLQYIGTDVFREIYPNVWIDYGMKLYRKLMEIQEEIYKKSDNSSVNGVVFSDVRFENEFNAIRDEGGYLFRIIRTNKDGTPFVDREDETRCHASETGLDLLGDDVFDAVLTAVSGDLDGLKNQAKRFIELWKNYSAGNMPLDDDLPTAAMSKRVYQEKGDHWEKQ